MDADGEPERRRVDAGLVAGVGDDERVGRRAHQDLRGEVAEELYLLLRVAPRHRDDGASETLGAVVRPEPAGEEAVAVGDVDEVAGTSAGGADRARDERRPGVDVARGVAHDGRFPGGPGRRVHARQPLAWHREEAERVGLPKVVLHREGEAGEVGEVAQVVRVRADGLALSAVRGDVRVGVAHRPAEALELECGELVAARDLDRVEGGAVGGAPGGGGVGHRGRTSVGSAGVRNAGVGADRVRLAHRRMLRIDNTNHVFYCL